MRRSVYGVAIQCINPTSCQFRFSYAPSLITVGKSYHRLGNLVIGDDRDIQSAIRTLEYQLLVPPRLEEIADCPYENEPSNDHQSICKPVAVEAACGCGRCLRCLGHGGIGCSCGAVSNLGRIKVVAVGVQWRYECRVVRIHWRGRCGFVRAAHVETVLDECDAESCS